MNKSFPVCKLKQRNYNNIHLIIIGVTIMEVQVEKNDNYNLMQVSGRLDSTTATEFEKHLIPMLESGKENLVDFKELNYISSSGLRVLLVAAKQLSDTDEKLSLIAMQDHIKEVFDISGFTDLFNILPSNPHE